jgi:hypothetical protein
MRSCETTRAAPCLRLNTCPQSGNQRLRARASAAERRTRTPAAPAVVGDAIPARDPNPGPRFDHVRAGRENRSARDDRRGREAIGGMMVSPGMLPGLGRCRARRCENRYGAKRKHEYLRFHGRYPLQSGTRTRSCHPESQLSIRPQCPGRQITNPRRTRGFSPFRAGGAPAPAANCAAFRSPACRVASCHGRPPARSSPGLWD